MSNTISRRRYAISCHLLHEEIPAHHKILRRQVILALSWPPSREWKRHPGRRRCRWRVQLRHSTCRPLEECHRTWSSRTDATTLVGYTRFAYDNDESDQFRTLTVVHGVSHTRQRPQEFISTGSSLWENARGQSPHGRRSFRTLPAPSALVSHQAPIRAKNILQRSYYNKHLCAHPRTSSALRTNKHMHIVAFLEVTNSLIL